MNNFMQSTKVTLSIRPKIMKENIVRREDRPKKLSLTQQFENTRLSKSSSKRKIKMRKTQMIDRKETERWNFSSHVEKKKTARKPEKLSDKLPDIYHPKPSSNKYFSTGKEQVKSCRAKAQSLIERKITETQLTGQKSNNQSSRKTESYNKPTYKIKQAEASKELTKQQKLEMYRMIRGEFTDLINASNSVSVRNPANHFRGYIEKGNNGILVKEILKKRWWWHLEEDPSKANLVWTEWHDKALTGSLGNFKVLDETISIDDYKIREFNTPHLKSGAIKKLVDDGTFEKIEKNINLMSNNYFKPLRPSFQSSVKLLTISQNQIIHNHVDGCLNLHSKKLLFMNFHKFMAQKSWNAFDFIPLTFYIDSADSVFVAELFAKFDDISENQKEEQNVWIVKPGENSNRGNGIKVVATREKLREEIDTRLGKEKDRKRTIIVQKYLEKCFLINNRKFDIRCYILITTVNGILKGYWYKDGYIRTSSSEYDLSNVEDEMIHLTNDAIQKKGHKYGKHEDSNKMSYDGFRQYLKKMGVNPSKFDTTCEQMKFIAYYLIASVSTKIKRKQFTFELFGLDYMLDSDMKPLLIEANSNPCISNQGKILSKLIYELIDNVIATAIDPIFPPPSQNHRKGSEFLNKDLFEANKFELIFAGKIPDFCKDLTMESSGENGENGTESREKQIIIEL